MSLQFGPPPPPPPPVFMESYRIHDGRGSIGPVIAVLVVIALLGVIAGIVGRLCSGRTVMGYGHYDLEGWIERKCASCIDGRLEDPPPRPSAPLPSVNGTVAAAPAAADDGKQPESSAESAEP